MFSIRLLIFSFIATIIPILAIGQKYANIHGVSVESPATPFQAQSYQSIVDVNSNWVAIIPYGFSRKDEPKVYFDSDRQWWGERPEGIEKMISMAHEKGLKVMLKPQVWMHNTWVGEFQLKSEKDWLTWEKSYRDYILTFVKIAEKHKVELFCIGTEYRYAVENRPEFWSTLISDIRLIYRGELTYAANWDEYKLISFWHELDYIGVDAYFPLSDNPIPSLPELESAWAPIKADLNFLSRTIGKPVLFTEYGYRSIEGSTGNQWELDGNPVSMEAQSIAYSAFYKTFWKTEFVAGGFIWKWHISEESIEFLDSKYSPQGKPVLKIIESSYR